MKTEITPEESRVKVTASRALRKLDETGFPAWDLFPIKFYLEFAYMYTIEGLKDRSLKVMNFATSRGCAYSCRFCSKTFRGVRLRSAENIADEIKQLKT